MRQCATCYRTAQCTYFPVFGPQLSCSLLPIGPLFHYLSVGIRVCSSADRWTVFCDNVPPLCCLTVIIYGLSVLPPATLCQLLSCLSLSQPAAVTVLSSVTTHCASTYCAAGRSVRQPPLRAAGLPVSPRSVLPVSPPAPAPCCQSPRQPPLRAVGRSASPRSVLPVSRSVSRRPPCLAAVRSRFGGRVLGRVSSGGACGGGEPRLHPTPSCSRRVARFGAWTSPLAFQLNLEDERVIQGPV